MDEGERPTPTRRDLNSGDSRPGTVEDGQRRLAAIMFTDMVGYSALAQADESAALSVLRRHNRLLRPIFAKHHGREIKTVGDAFLVEFDSAQDATQCALEIQQSLHDYNASAPDDWRILVRIGIHVGDVVQSNGDVLGDAVNIASRIEPLADPEGICLSQQVVDQVQNKIPVHFARLPPVALKNIRSTVTVYRVVPPWEAPRGDARPKDAGPGHQLAVLPLTNISPDPNDAYFADGLTEELISVLSQVHGLSVIARTSVAPYKTAPKSIAQVGADLGVDSVLEGSVRKAGRQIRITLQLIDVASQHHMWASSYNREVDDVFAVQTDIAERTAQALRLELASAKARDSERPPTSDPEAYDAYLRGLVAASVVSWARFDEAAQYFEKATTLDPNFAEAYAAWADLLVGGAGDVVSMRKVIPRARELTARALELDPRSSNAHLALANMVFQFDRDWVQAEAEFRKSIELNPSNARAHRVFGLLLMALDRLEEAKEVLRRAIQLDPSGENEGMLAWAEVESGNYEVGVRLSEKFYHGNSTPAHEASRVGFLYLQAGRKDDALRLADAPVAGATEDERFDLALLNALLGRPDAAREEIAEVERGEAKTYISATHLAMLHAALGNKERALDLLEQDAREGDQVLWLWYRGVFFDSLRDEPRFLALLREFGLPTAKPHRPGAPREEA